MHFEKILSALKVVQAPCPDHFESPDDAHRFLEPALSKLDEQYAQAFIDLYAFECERQNMLDRTSQSRLQSDHEANIQTLARGIKTEDPLRFNYRPNPNARIVESNYDWDRFHKDLCDSTTPQRSQQFYFIRRSITPDSIFFEERLEGWNKILIDLYQHDLTFVGYELLDALAEDETLEHVDLEQKVGRFLAIQSIYFNSLILQPTGI